MIMKVKTTIVITENVSEGLEVQVKRNFDRSGNLNDSDLTFKNHIMELMPNINENQISVQFKLIEGEE